MKFSKLRARSISSHFIFLCILLFLFLVNKKNVRSSCLNKKCITSCSKFVFNKNIFHYLYVSVISFRPKEIQEIILVSPMGVSKLMDLLGDSREVIRNDVRHDLKLI